IGCGEGVLVHKWAQRLGEDRRVVGIDLDEESIQAGWEERQAANLEYRVMHAENLPFADDEFDLVYSSSVIEHVQPARRDAFASEVRRVGRGWFVQTPALSFPIEPHALLPFAHWLPTALRRPYWRLGAAGDWEDISLLSRREMEALFGSALPERIGPLVKSWVCVRAPLSPR
ncbi:MAG TPA: class I SAM-dependent methyltransferase, partial [Solirubrobacteraceae bacterium]|nr:class I SAM-dependent methyltransferase [Solirubrobacteraceae bacterium]